MSKEITLFICSPQSFCAGVENALKIVDKTLAQFGTPIYVLHEIVHNKHIVEKYKQKGVCFIEKIEDMNDLTRPLIFSAHGVSKKIEEEVIALRINTIDATCPLVKKIHKKVQQLEKENNEIVIIGKKNHQEVLGIIGQADENSKIYVINSLKEVEELKPTPNKIGFVTQTTLSVDETQEIIKALKNKFPQISAMNKEDICFATTQRQKAIKETAPKVDAFIIIGSKNSSNSNRLKEVALFSGVNKVFLIDDQTELNWDDFSDVFKIGISSGASAPMHLVDELVDAFKRHYEKIKIQDDRMK